MTRLVVTSIEVVGGNEAARKMIAKKLNDTGRFDSYKIVVDSKYASYVEYGTNPPNPNRVQRLGESTLMKNIEKWIGDKPRYAAMTKRQRHDLAGRIYHSILEHGTAPHPFAEPAYNNARMMVEEGYFNNKSHSTETLSNEIIQMMRAYLVDNDSYVTGELSASIHKEKTGGIY